MDSNFLRIASDVKLGRDVRLAAYINLYGCEVGDGSSLGTFVEIQKQAVVGRRVKIQSHTFICSGVVIEDEVFVGHGVMFTNDLFPRATTENGSLQGEQDWECVPTRVCRGASIGSNATILCGITIGEGAMVGAGALVAHDVPPRAVVAGNPAKIIRTLD